MKRVLVTGIGVVSPIGIECNQVFENLLIGNSKFIKESRAYRGFGCSDLSLQISNYDKQMIFEKTLSDRDKNMPLASVYAIYAVKKALENAKISQSTLCKKRVAVIIGNNDMNSDVLDDYIENQNMNYSSYTGGSIVSNISKSLGLKYVREVCVHNTCASSNMAIEIGEKYIRENKCDIAIVGGSDSFSKKTFVAFSSVRAISKNGCRPFAKDRDGITISEGTGIIILENEDNAKERGFENWYCEIIGSASSNDAKSLEAPDADGIELAYTKLLKKTSIKFDDIECIMSHGTGTILNDNTELEVIRRFAKNEVRICSIKNIVGHMMSASGAFACIIICLMYKNKIIPGNISYETEEMDSRLKLVKQNERMSDLNIIVSHSFGFGGNNSIILFGKYLH